MAEFSQAPWSAAFNVRTGAGQAAANEIEDIKYGEQLRQRNEQMAQAKAQLFANDIDFQNGSNPYDSAIIMNENTELVRRLGEFTTKYQDWNTNPQRAIEFKQLKQSQKSTPAVLRSTAYKNAVGALNADLAEVAKNPGRYNTKAYEGILKQVDNYNKYGNQNGRLAAETQGPQPFVYQRPRDFIDENKMYRDVGAALEPDAREDMKNGRMGAYERFVSDKNLVREADAIYRANQEQFDQIYTENGQDPIASIASKLKPFTKKEYFEGYQDEFSLFKRKANYEAALKKSAETQSTDPYKVVIFDTNNIAPSDEKAIAATFGSTPTVQFKGPNGNIVESGNRFYWTGLRDKGYREDGKYSKDGLKIGDGYIIKPIEYGKELGVLEDTQWIGEKLEVKPEYADSYEIFTPPPNEKGESVPVLKVRAQTEVNAANPDYARKFNAYIHSTTKQREGVGESSLLNQDLYQDEKGNLFTKDAGGNAIPYQR